MNRFIFFMGICLVLSCSRQKKTPDISKTVVPLQVQHYEQDFFSLDTLVLDKSLSSLERQYGSFHADFMYNILGTSKATAGIDVLSFIRSYKPLATDVATQKKALSMAEKEVLLGMRYIHYYFPSYSLPKRYVSFIGPINSYGCIVTSDVVAVGLQLFLGAQHPIYTSEQGQALFPLFVSRKFDPAYIPVAVMNTLIDDMYPNNSLGQPLVEQMIEAGKRLYLLDAFLPQLPDSLKTGYTSQQLITAFKSEKTIWSFFVQNDLLFKSDPELTRDYINDGPYTAALGPESPGRIGLFVGWQIVKKWMDKHPTTSFKTLMEKEAGKLFSESKYKPS